MSSDGGVGPPELEPRRSAPSASALRNRGPILAALQPVIPATGVVLEIASGTGDHVVFFAAGLPGVRWQPTDADVGVRQSIAAWRDHHGLENVMAPLELDTHSPWPVASADGVVAINMVHIWPWTVTLGLTFDERVQVPANNQMLVFGRR